VRVQVGAERLTVRDAFSVPTAALVHADESDELLRLVHVCALCSETVVFRQEGEHQLQGSATENALVQMAISSGIDVRGCARATLWPPYIIVPNSGTTCSRSRRRERARLVAVKEVRTRCWTLRLAPPRRARLPMDDDTRTASLATRNTMPGNAAPERVRPMLVIACEGLCGCHRPWAGGSVRGAAAESSTSFGLP